MSILTEKFEEIVIRDQDVFDKSNRSILEMVANMIEDNGKFIFSYLFFIFFINLADSTELVEEWGRMGEKSKDKWEILCQFIDTKVSERRKLKKNAPHKIDFNLKAYKRLKYLKEEILLVFLYPRLDAHVSTDIGHLLKSPFCVHPKTGRVCVPFKTENLNTFDPFSAPFLKDLVKDYNNGKNSKFLGLYKYKLDGENESVYQKRMFEYYKNFDEFVRKLEVFCKKYKMNKQKKKTG